MTERLRYVRWGLLAVGTLLRISYLLDYSALPFAEGPLGDSAVYLHQAAKVRAGVHGDSSLLAMSPGYGYVLAAFLDVPWWLLVLQSILGLGVALVLASVAKRLAGARAELAALALYLGYGLVPFYESKLLSDSLGLLLAIATVALSTSAGVRAGRWPWGIATGVVLGLAVLVRAHLIFVVPLLVVAAAARWDRGEPRARGWTRSAAIALGVGLVLLLRGLSTWSASGAFVAVLYTAPDAHVVARSSAGAYDGTLGAVGFESTAPRSAWDVVRAVDQHRRAPAGTRTRAGLLSTAASVDVVGVLRNLPDRLWRAFRDVETTYQYSYYGERDEITALRVLPVTFSTLAWLALVGALSLRARVGARALWPFAPWVLGILVTCLLYLPTARYRFPMLVALVPLAGVGVDTLVQLWTNHSPRGRALVLVTTALALFTAWRTVTYERQNPARWHLQLAESWAGQPHDPEVLEAHLEAARRGSRGADGRVDPRIEAWVHAIRGHSNRGSSRSTQR